MAVRFVFGLALAAALGGTPAGAVIMVGQPAPDFTLRDEGEVSYTLSQFRGRVVLLGLIGHN